MKTAGIYIHIPFCLGKCNYCDFYSLTPSDESFNNYVNELAFEIEKNSDKTKKIDTIYIGGGTPSVLSLFLLEKIAKSVYKSFHCDIKEFTIEVNPCSSKDIEYYKDFGVNRISFGVQSLDDNILKILGRKHNSKQAISTLERATKYYDNISADIILGVKSNQNIENDIDIIKNYVKHFSAYLLKVEEGTPLYLQREKRTYVQPDEDETVKQYEKAYEILQKNSINRYEISNFALKGYESKHNLKYWQMEDYYGFGTSAHSFLNGKRYYNNASLPEYIEGNHSGNNKQIEEQTDLFMETVMLGLRLEKGLDITELNKDFGIDFCSTYENKIQKLQPYIEISDRTLKIKPQYMLLQNSIMVEFLDC